MSRKRAPKTPERPTTSAETVGAAAQDVIDQKLAEAQRRGELGRYELGTERQRASLHRVQAQHAAAQQAAGELVATGNQLVARGRQLAQEADAAFLETLEHLLVGMGVELPKGCGLRVEGTTVVAVRPDAATSPAGGQGHCS